MSGGKYNFNIDLEVSEKSTNEEVIPLLKSLGYSIMKTNDDNKFDIHVKNTFAEYLIEYKQDFKCRWTGNVFVEFESRNKLSGINTSMSDIYLYKIHTPDDEIIFHATPTKKLKKFIDENKLRLRVGYGGDPGSNTKGYLINIQMYLNLGMKILVHKIKEV